MNRQGLTKGTKIARRMFDIYYSDTPPDKFKNINAAFGVLRKTKTLCSCIMCGNPRKYFGKKTRQEQVAELNHKEQVGELSLHGSSSRHIRNLG